MRARFPETYRKGFTMKTPIHTMRRNFHKVVLVTAVALTLAMPSVQAQAATA